MKRKRLGLLLLVLLTVPFAGGCLQEQLVNPVATVTGKIIPPPAKDVLGTHITVAGYPQVAAYVKETGEYKLEFTKTGRYLLIARSREFDVDFVWVDAVLEQTVKAADLKLSEKIAGEAKFVATKVDYPDATKFSVKSLDPVWASQTAPLYDDGTHGDRLANDGIFTTRITNLLTGTQLYSIVYDHPDPDDASKTKTEEVKDPHRETERSGKSEIIIKDPIVKVAQGRVVSDLVGANYAEVVLASKGGARKIFLNSDGSYSFPMEGNGREYLVFRSPAFHIKTVPVDLSTNPVYEVPDTKLIAKGGGEIRLCLIKSDWQLASGPTVVGDWTNWQPQALFDDGTHGDDAAGDGVYTYTATQIAPGYHKYAFNITTGNQVRDPYEESADSQYSILLVK